jgi:hypothetical protein
MNVEEFRDKSNDMLMEVTDYIQEADISYREKQKRTVELSITLFMTSIRMNSETEAKIDFVHHIHLLIEAVEETIDLYFHGKQPTTCESITKGKTYKVRNDD